MPRAIDRPSVLWTVRKDHDSLECSVELLPHGLQAHMAINGRTPYHSRTSDAGGTAGLGCRGAGAVRGGGVELTAEGY